MECISLCAWRFLFVYFVSQCKFIEVYWVDFLEIFYSDLFLFFFYCSAYIVAAL